MKRAAGWFQEAPRTNLKKEVVKQFIWPRPRGVMRLASLSMLLVLSKVVRYLVAQRANISSKAGGADLCGAPG